MTTAQNPANNTIAMLSKLIKKYVPLTTPPIADIKTSTILASHIAANASAISAIAGLKITCQNCGGHGHKFSNCATPTNGTANLNIECKMCTGKGHLAPYCTNNAINQRFSTNKTPNLPRVPSHDYTRLPPRAPPHDHTNLPRAPPTRHPVTCRNWNRGHCNRGSSCKFAHHLFPPRDLPPRRRDFDRRDRRADDRVGYNSQYASNKPCYAFQNTGNCSRDFCKFSHDQKFSHYQHPVKYQKNIHNALSQIMTPPATHWAQPKQFEPHAPRVFNPPHAPPVHHNFSHVQPVHNPYMYNPHSAHPPSQAPVQAPVQQQPTSSSSRTRGRSRSRSRSPRRRAGRSRSRSRSSHRRAPRRRGRSPRDDLHSSVRANAAALDGMRDLLRRNLKRKKNDVIPPPPKHPKRANILVDSGAQRHIFKNSAYLQNCERVHAVQAQSPPILNKYALEHVLPLRSFT